MLSRLLNLFYEKVENRYYGKYRAIVHSNEDPDKRGRLLVKVPALLGEKIIGWAMPCFPYGGRADVGFYMVPEKDDGVWVEFEAGDLSYPIWTGTWWAKGEAPKGVENTEPEPSLKLIKTKGKHLIELKDKDGKESITIIDKSGNKIMMHEKAIEINAASHDLILKGNKITVEAAGDLNLKGAKFNVNASGKVVIKGATIDMN